MRLRVPPGARKTAFKGPYKGGGGALKLAVAAPPVGGKANAEVERLAAAFGVAKSVVEVRSGFGGRSKRVVVSGVSLQKARRRLDGVVC